MDISIEAPTAFLYTCWEGRHWKSCGRRRVSYPGSLRKRLVLPAHDQNRYSYGVRSGWPKYADSISGNRDMLCSSFPAMILFLEAGAQWPGSAVSLVPCVDGILAITLLSYLLAAVPWSLLVYYILPATYPFLAQGICGGFSWL